MHFLDVQQRIFARNHEFWGTIRRTSVYSREVVKDGQVVNAASKKLANNHPSCVGESCRPGEFLTQTLKTVKVLVDVSVLDHQMVAGADARSFAELGLL